MKNVEHVAAPERTPTIFFHDTDEQVLTWYRHAQSMTGVEGRWQQVWNLFANAARQECARRHIDPQS